MEETTLPADILVKPSEEEKPEGVLCGVCHRQFSRYSCPRCNLAYCSLPCFRSEAHNSCSEGFYKTQLETDIRSAPSKSAEERKEMMEVLKRFEEENADDDLDEDDEEDELEKKLRDVNLDDASYDELWEILTPAQRTKFMSALQDPSSTLAQDLLAASGNEEDELRLWWEPDAEDLASSVANNSWILPHAEARPEGAVEKPQLMSVPASLVKPQQSSFPLAYNHVTIFIAYVYTSRHLTTSPLSHSTSANVNGDARQIICGIVPFLADKRSTTRFPTLESAITDVWSRFEPESMDSRSFASLLKDTAKLLRPIPVVLLDDTTAASPEAMSSHQNALLALSDLHALFSSNVTSPTRPTPRADHICAKIAFYAGQVLSTDARFFEGLAEEVDARADRETTQSQEFPTSENRRPERRSDKPRQGRIVELD
ncbi:hypothetical protein PENSPDRAFT_755787 [Peniophora sp. CONT]|nr:hypothetical protein PENSPDRAFT_755787 [Peniophora sp. CONT]